MTQALELADIQGDILRAYGNSYDCTSYAFVRMECEPEQARAWFAGLIDHVTAATPWRRKPRTTLNVAVTASGLDALGVAAETIASFSHEFRQGMAARAEQLGDTGPSAPARWERGLGTGDAHVLLTINAQTTADQRHALGRMEAAMQAAGGVRIVFQQDAELLQGAREHFGFADGFAQPAIEGATEEKAAGGGVLERDGRWRPLAPGEFILGYPDEDTNVDRRRRLPPAPDGVLGRNATYMVWRKLHQDVALFRRTIEAAAKRYPYGDATKLAAKVVGRWQDGTPLETNPHGPDPQFDPAAPGANEFRYSSDPAGRRCPLGAHIRRSNPRDALGHASKLSFRHRMIRRGRPYGAPLPAGETADDGAERGLVFVSFQASIFRQFEGVQTPWINDGNIFGLGTDKDFLLGDPSGSGKMTIQGEKPFFLAPQGPFVVTRGGEYLFVPGISGLQAIAEGVV